MDDNFGHRDVDADGNPDDKYTEKEAIALAKEQGIEFVDEWVIVDENFVPVLDDVVEMKYATEKEALKHVKKGQSVMQRRSQK